MYLLAAWHTETLVSIITAPIRQPDSPTDGTWSDDEVMR
jgi:hypothetical protein